MKIYLDLFRAFFTIGALTFGGGYAMLPMLEKEITERRSWATSEELLDFYAIGQCTPGIIAVNVATLVGFRQKGYLGAVFSTAGVVAPSYIIISLIANAISAVAGNELVSHAFGGIRVAVCVLVASAVGRLVKPGVTDALTAVIFLACFAVMTFTGVSPIIVVVAAAAVGYCKSFFVKSKGV